LHQRTTFTRRTINDRAAIGKHDAVARLSRNDRGETCSTGAASAPFDRSQVDDITGPGQNEARASITPVAAGAFLELEEAPGAFRLADWRVLSPEGPQGHEKNWMPRVTGAGGERLEFIYRCDPTRIVDEAARTVSKGAPAIAADQFRGGTQLIAFDGGWLALVHEARVRDDKRQYRHRFVWFDAGSALAAVSRPFFFSSHGVEFAMGLAWKEAGESLVITYGVADQEAWIATVDAGDVRGVLEAVGAVAGGRTG